MPINKDEAQAAYRDNASRSGDKLVKRYTSVTNKAERAASDSAQKAFEDAMKDSEVLKRRQKRLKTVTEADLNAAMTATGAATYNSRVSASAPKWGTRTAPYLDALDNITSKLPERTRDAEQNVMRRVVPIAKGLAAKKKEMG